MPPNHQQLRPLIRLLPIASPHAAARRFGALSGPPTTVWASGLPSRDQFKTIKNPLKLTDKQTRTDCRLSATSSSTGTLGDTVGYRRGDARYRRRCFLGSDRMDLRGLARHILGGWFGRPGAVWGKRPAHRGLRPLGFLCSSWGVRRLCWRFAQRA
eukprot:GHVT01048230.1.p1 GENE.GHVT01048230.1~~GHVT01048230.1.p1  ORF type:complete len:156 (+),score=14.19 GHVT01048230.1:2165-2632(+)